MSPAPGHQVASLRNSRNGGAGFRIIRRDPVDEPGALDEEAEPV
jgi:hypothetical protein